MFFFNDCNTLIAGWQENHSGNSFTLSQRTSPEKRGDRHTKRHSGQQDIHTCGEFPGSIEGA